MATAGSVVVNLVANTGRFTKGMSKSKRAIDSFGDKVGSVMRQVKRFGIAAGAAAITGLVALTKKSMDNIDVIAKLSDRIGVSTEFLSAFGHAAKITGTSQEEFNKSIEMFVRRLGEVKMGSGEAKDALKALGISLDEIIGQSPERSFLRIAAGIRRLGTQSEKSAAAYKLFGRTGSKMLNLLESDLSGVRAEADRLGITFSRDMAAQVEVANDAITDLKAVLTGLGNAIAIDTAPAVKRLADYMADLGIASKDVSLLDKVISVTFNEIGMTLENFADIDRRMSSGADGITTTMEAWAEGFKIFGKEIEDGMIAPAKKAVVAVQKLDDELGLIRRLQQNPAQFLKSPMFGNIGLSYEDESPTVIAPSAREIDTSQVSVAGLASMGEEQTLEKRQVSLLESIERSNRKIANQEVLN